MEQTRSTHTGSMEGPMYMAQLTLKLFIEDDEYSPSEKEKAREIYHWITNTNCKIKDLFRRSPEYGMFLLETMKIYEISSTISESFRVLDYIDALESLQSQYDKYLKDEEFLQQMALATITDENYRGYD